MKIFRADGCYVPRSLLRKEDVIKHAEKTFYFNPLVCNKCDKKDERPSGCTGCENFLGHYKLWSLHNDKQYVRLPRDMFFRLKDYFGIDVKEHQLVDKRKTPPMPHLDMFKFKYSMLREDQRVTLAQMYKWHEEGIRGAIKAAPRTGKTVMSMALMHKLKLRAAWIAPQEELLRGFRADAEKFTNILELEQKVGRILIGVPRDVEDAAQMCISLLTPHTFISEKGWDSLDDYRMLFGTVGIDEYHRINSNVFSKVIDQFYARNLFGVSATEKRKDKKDLVGLEIVGPVLATSEAESLIPTVHIHDVGFKAKTKKSAKIYFYYRELFANKSYVDYAVKLILDLVSQGRKVVVPVVNKAHIAKLYAKLNRKVRTGVFARSTHPGYAGADLNRARVLDQARSGKLDVVLGIRSIIGVGVNVVPWTDLIVMCPTTNEYNMYQETKRVCTPAEGKAEPQVHFLVETGVRGISSMVHQYTHTIKRYKYKMSPKSLELIREWQEVLSRRNDDLSDDMFGAQVTDSEWYSADADDAEDDKEPLVATGLARADSSLNGSFF